VLKFQRRKTVWLFKPFGQCQGIDLLIRLEQTNSEPSEGACLIELHRQARDKVEKREFPVTKKALKEIQDGVYWLRDVPLPNRKKATGPFPAMQHRYEDESGLVVMREIPSSRSDDDMEIKYKLGDGAGFDYAFESFDALETFARKLEGSVWAKVSCD
jgi:hypothetical protein